LGCIEALKGIVVALIYYYKSLNGLLGLSCGHERYGGVEAHSFSLTAGRADYLIAVRF